MANGAVSEEIMHRVFTLSEVIERHQKLREPWFEFLRVPALSLGIYSLPVGSSDPQFSHPEDEVYYIVSGRAMLRVENEDRVADPRGDPVRPCAHEPSLPQHPKRSYMSRVFCFASRIGDGG